MNWKEVKQSITKQLLERDLSDPRIRLNALACVENLIEGKFVDKPLLLLTIDKNVLKEDLAKKKMLNLNGAEKSIINHIYDVLNGKPIPRRK